MNTIREVFDSLQDQQKKQLLYALEHEIPQHIELEGRYIGVHVSGRIPNLNPEMESGVWSVGKIRKAK